VSDKAAIPAVAIYALCCPDTGLVRYIGKANDPAKRYAGHLRERRGNTPKVNWVQKCVKSGKPPKLQVLAWVLPHAWPIAERQLIAEHRAKGRMLNVADGGDEPHCPTEVRAANGRQTAASIHSDPVRRRMWEIKRSLGDGLKRGHVSESAKAKMRAAAVRHPQYFGAWAGI